MKRKEATLGGAKERDGSKEERMEEEIKINTKVSTRLQQFFKVQYTSRPHLLNSLNFFLYRLEVNLCQSLINATPWTRMTPLFSWRWQQGAVLPSGWVPCIICQIRPRVLQPACRLGQRKKFVPERYRTWIFPLCRAQSRLCTIK